MGNKNTTTPETGKKTRVINMRITEKTQRRIVRLAIEAEKEYPMAAPSYATIIRHALEIGLTAAERELELIQKGGTL